MTAQKKATDSFHLFLLVLYSVVLLALMTTAVVTPKGEVVMWINGHHYPFTDIFFRLITYLGDGLVFIPVLVAFLFIRHRFVLIGIAAWAGHGLISFILKRWIFADALRPKVLLDNDLLYFVPGVDVHEYHSFPSGHTTTIFCLALLVSLVFNSRTVTILMILIALTVGYSRIYLLQHFLADVAGGAVLGTLTALIFWIVFQRRPSAAWLERRLRWPPSRELKE